MSPITYPLEFLFIAEAQNGTIIKQNPDDVSRLDPTKSAFYDVLQNLPLKSFSLHGRGNIFTIDLIDGSISINGTKHYPPKRPPVGAKITPIYYRKVIQTAQVSYQKKTFKERMGIEILKRMGIESTTSPGNTTVQYYIGWQAHIDGKNVKYEMEVK